MPTPDKQRDTQQRQSQEQRQSGTRQDQSQKQTDEERTIADETPPKGSDPSEVDRLLQEDVERAKKQRENKPGTERDPAGISPQDDLA
jgi:hypothetical protein